jgi:glycosyltransferase involved in cell wall biosynthesis
MSSTICLNMIVRDEAHVIERCLSTLRPVIDSWVIVDTGSIDGTQDVVRAALAGIPGELHERTWVDFGTNRTQALALAKGRADYTLVFDADEELLVPGGFTWPDLTEPAYSLEFRLGAVRYSRACIVRNDLPWRFEGVLHEYLTCGEKVANPEIPGLQVRVHSDGGRSKIDPIAKYSRDAQILEQALVDDPDNTRYLFYLAQSYRDSQQYEAAVAAYERRAAAGGWDEEVWYCLYELGKLSEKLDLADGVVLDRYLKAFEFRPTRAESLYQLARRYRERRAFATGKVFAEAAMAISEPSDRLFVESDIYVWRALDEYAICSYWVGNYLESAATGRALLAGGLVPAEHRERIIANLTFAADAL